MININVGCGKRNFGEGWIHVDGENHPHVASNDIYLVLFENVNTIHSSHLLEYFNRDEALTLLRSWYLALKPGGELHIAVPDFESIVKLYASKEYELEQFLGLLYGQMTMNDDNIYHKTVYDYKSLNSLLAKAGFTNIQRVESIVPYEHDDHSEARLPHRDPSGTRMSLNVIAIK